MMGTDPQRHGEERAARFLRPVAATALVVLAAAGCGGEPGRVESTGEPVRVTVSPPREAPTSVAFPGTVTPVRRAELGTRTSGTVEAVHVEVGSRVAPGDTLVVLDTADVRARIEQARAGAEVARKSFRRIRNLEAEGAATGQELDEARARLDVAEGRLREALSQRPYTVLLAPYAGAVTVRNVDPGDLAVPGRSVITLEGSGAVKVVADLPATAAGGVAVGDGARIVDPSTGREAEGRVVHVVPSVDPGSRRFRVEVRPAADASSLPAPGGYVRILLEGGEPTRWIPRDAVVRRGQLTGVYTVEDDRLRLRWVRLGREAGDAVELLAGPPGEYAVVRSPGMALRDGLPVAGVERAGWEGVR